MTSNGPALNHVGVLLVLSVMRDIRDRTTQEYRDFFDRLVADIRARGIQIPLIGYREAGKVRLIDGMTRYLAAMLAGLETVPILVYEEKPVDKELVLASLLANTMRLGMTPLELAPLYVELMKLNGGCSQAQLAKALHVSPAQVAKVLAISTRLHPNVQALVASGELSPRAAYAISRLLDQKQQVELAQKAVRLPMAVESVEEAVAKILGTGKRNRQKPLRVRLPGVLLVMGNPTIEGVQQFIERVAAVLKRIVKDGDGIELLPARLKGQP